MNADLNPNPKLHYSVALCTFNGDKYIKGQIESILRQSVKVDEIVICDDGSTDNTLELINTIIANNPTDTDIRLYKNSYNLGVVKNFSKCIALCLNDYVFLSDQDDLWDKDKVKKYESLFHSGYEIIFSDAYIVDDTLRITKKSLFKHLGFNPKSDPRNFLLKQSLITGATLAFHRKIYHYALPFNDHYLHDGWLGIIGVYFFKYFIIQEALIFYRQHNSNVAGIKLDSLFKKFNKNIKNLKRVEKTREENYFRICIFHNQFKDHFKKNDLAKVKKALDFWLQSKNMVKNGKIVNLFFVIKNFFNYFRFNNGLNGFFRDLIWIVFT
jgi:glycosyltransferase involved in cell wall biosynthesis